MESIIKAVCDDFHITPTELKTGGSTRNLVEARMVSAYLLHEAFPREPSNKIVEPLGRERTMIYDYLEKIEYLNFGELKQRALKIKEHIYQQSAAH